MNAVRFRWPDLTALRSLAWLLVPLHVGTAASAAVQEIKVSPAPIFDFEFDYDSNRFAWLGDLGELWVGYVDPVTGAFAPVTGKAELVDTGTVLPGNGPEWAASPTGNRLVYTKNPSNILWLAQASFDGTAWQGSLLLAGAQHILPLGNSEPLGSFSPILSLVLGSGGGTSGAQLAWRMLGFPTEKIVPQSLGATGGRWVQGEVEIVFSAPINGGRQAFFYDGMAHATQQLTFDNGLKQTVFMWEAPEFPGEKIFFSSVKGPQLSQIRVYRYLDPDGDGQFAWTSIKTINPPSLGLFFWSPEPFVHNGRSYIFWVASSSPDQPDPSLPSQIWMAAADPADSLYVSLSDPTLSRFRLDPEIFVTSQGPFVYYNRFLPGTPQQYEGVYRVNTELGPVQAAPSAARAATSAHFEAQLGGE